jgi:hypothetical protein
LRRYFSRKPSPSLVLSIIALFVALGGVSYGLAGKNTVKSDDIVNGTVKGKDIKNDGVKSKDIKNDGVKGKDIRTNAVTSPDVAPDSLVGEDINENTLDKVGRASHADQADNADTLGGSPASAFAPSTVVRWAEVDADGTIDDSSGITQANVDKRGTGFYCFGGLNPAPRGVTATLRSGGSFGAQIFSDATDGACTDNQVAVFTYNSANTSTDQPFTVVLY